MMRGDFQEVIDGTGVFNCMDCGKCTSVCPISFRDNKFSPRKTVLAAVYNGPEKLAESERTWNCLTCNMCTNRCPMGVEFTDFIREIRDRSFLVGNRGYCTHGCTIRTWGEMMSRETVHPNRLDWLTNDLRTTDEGELAYFVGCLPMYSRFFPDLAADAVETARNTLRVLNWIGVEPVVMGEEVCCGHDFLWSGDNETFANLAARNIQAMRERGIKKVVASCAECFRTLKADYPTCDEGFALEVFHTSELFLDKIETGALRVSEEKRNGKVTYHDPCRLSKHMGITSVPRELMQRIEGLEFVEMPRSGKRSVCCGTSLWMNCNWISKEMQIERLREAVGTGSRTLLTTCPKCKIHFNCAMGENGKDEDVQIEIQDLSSLLAELIGGG